MSNRWAVPKVYGRVTNGPAPEMQSEVPTRNEKDSWLKSYYEKIKNWIFGNNCKPDKIYQKLNFEG